MGYFGPTLSQISDGPGGTPLVLANLKKYGMGFSENLLRKCSGKQKRAIDDGTSILL